VVYCDALRTSETEANAQTACPLGIIAATFFSLEVNDMSNHAVSFESTRIGTAPEGWTATLTGSGDPKWTVESDQTAPSKSNVVKQSDRATYRCF